MSNKFKNQDNILQKMNIKGLNPMQEEAHAVISSSSEIILLSPTGTGKTLAFLLPIIAGLDRDVSDVQVLIVVPSRELAIQIEQVIREMGTGYKANAVYGGRSGSKDKIELQHLPAILIGTPGRIADHIRRERFSTKMIKTLVLDEFDKSLEIGFESEMKEIVNGILNISKKILTSATKKVVIPKFIKLDNPSYINYLDEGIPNLKIKTIPTNSKERLDVLEETLCFLGNEPGIIFCNYKDTIQEVSDFLKEKGIFHGFFYGGMEQKDRERALIKFRNGSHKLLIATDLAARGIDVPEIKFIIHFQLPLKSHEFVHRNGRTARMHKEGTAYIFKREDEKLPDYIEDAEIVKIKKNNNPELPKWVTIFVSGGRKDKISKGDIVGLFLKQGNLNIDEIGIIELKADCAFVGVHAAKVHSLISKVDNTRLKKKKIKVIEI